ncbi:MAG: hypothetical protein KKI08_04955 [Armatimonadetes bacterium]|nr:hypothetical protein [Armatimonadota bacterium]
MATSIPVAQPTAPSPRSGIAAAGLTWRSLIVALILIPPNVYWVEQMEIMRYSAHPTTVSLFFNAVFIALVLAALNALLRKAIPRAALSQPETLMVYSMVCIASCLCGHDGIQVLMPIFTWSFWMATPENQWEKLFDPDLPRWLTVQDERILKGFYEGGQTMYRPEVLSAWATPMLMWGLFILALIMVMVGIGAIIRRQWLEGEHLACPLVKLPLEITEPGGSLFGQKMFWIGFAVAASVDIYNSFAFLYPVIPKIPIDQQDMGKALTAKPWSAIGWFPRSFYPFVVGMGYLMPLDFLFSCWFFYLFWKMELVFSTAVGWNQIPQFPFANYQAFGAYMLFGVHALWIGRNYWGRVWDRIMGRPGGMDERNEVMTYRAAAAMIVVGLIFLVAFSAAIGLRAWLGVCFFLIYYALALAITRMRAQFGAPVHDLHFTGPDQILTSALGTRAFPKQDLITFALYYWFNRAYRNHPMPHMVEAMRMQSASGGRNRGVAPAVMIAAAVAIIAAFWTSLHMYYDLGATAKGRMFGGESFTKLASWLNAPSGTNWWALGAIGVGAVFGVFLQTMRIKYMWWPFHPLGFAVSGNWEMNLVWMPLLIAWLLKVAIVRYGGHKRYQQAVPAFLGLIVGQFVVGSILNIVSIILHIPSYMFWQ